MQLVITLLALGVFTLGVWWRQVGPQPVKQVSDELPSLISTPTLPPMATPTPELDVTLQPTKAPLPTVTTTPTNRYEEGWFYPGAQMVSGVGSVYRLQTSDHPDQVYDWYEARFNQLNLQVRTRVKAKANDTYNYRLNGASNDEEVDISIMKGDDSNQTRIEVKLNGVQAMM